MAFAATAGGQLEIDPVARVVGLLGLQASIDGAGIAGDAAAMANTFRGYETILRGRDVRDAVFISSRACGACGGSHAIASALACEMTYELRPPQYGITVRNMLSSIECLIELPVALFLRAGPDFSEPVVRDCNPELWTKAQSTPARGRYFHGLPTIADIMIELTRYTGHLYREAAYMSRVAREAFVVLGGKYPHAQTMVPCGISSTVDASDLSLVLLRVTRFTDYCRKVAAVWDDVMDFFLESNERYGEVGVTPTNFLDLGLWDDPDVYDASYENAVSWGEARWSTPGAVLGGRLQTTSLHEIDSGMEEYVDRSFYDDWTNNAPLLTVDPGNNPVTNRHPWNKETLPQPATPNVGGKYTWSTAARWRRNAMETGAPARLWITALAGKLPNRGFMEPTGKGIVFGLPQAGFPAGDLIWNIPQNWNAFERNRARAYALVHATVVAYENTLIGFDLSRIGGPEAAIFNSYSIPKDQVIGVGWWGGPRGYVSHHVEFDKKVIQNYQIIGPTTLMAARDPSGAPSVLEQAVTGTPSLTTAGGHSHIDVLRAIRSLDPCMSCATH